MPAYTWSFAQSFLVFLVIVFVSQSLATRLRSLIPMPLFFGGLLAGGFALGWLPQDLLLAPGSVVGGGASCAIGSRWVSGVRPEISFFPWMIFMFQGVFSVPAVTWALKQETARLVEEMSAQPPVQPPAGKPAFGPMAPAFGPSAKIPQDYKTPAYYLGLIMAVAVINYTLQGTVLAGLNINLNITALLLGMLAGSLGLVDRAPLFKCDSYGLLILSLMGLMANNLAGTPLDPCSHWLSRR